MWVAAVAYLVELVVVSSHLPFCVLLGGLWIAAPTTYYSDL